MVAKYLAFRKHRTQERYFGLRSDGKWVEVDKDTLPASVKPYSGEHACRLRDPKDFKPKSFRRVTRKAGGKPFSIIMGKLKDGDDAMVAQAYRYPKKEWDAAEAKKHCKEHDGGTFEAAGENQEAIEPDPKEVVVTFKEGESLVGILPFLIGNTVEEIEAAKGEDGWQFRLTTKRGQRIARRNLDLLEEAEELLTKALDEEDIPRPARALITSAMANVKRVIKDGKRDGDEEEEGKSLDVLARQLLIGLLAGKSLKGAALLNLLRELEPLKAAAEQEARRAELDLAERELLGIQ